MSVTNRELQLLDYMRGNGNRLSADGFEHLRRRWALPDGHAGVLWRAIAALVRKGLVEREGAEELPVRLTDRGARLAMQP